MSTPESTPNRLPDQARNDNDDSTSDEGGQLANPGPVPPEPEDVSDTGENPGDLGPQAAPDEGESRLA